MSNVSAAGNSASQTSTRLRVPEPVRIVNWPMRHGGMWVWMSALGIVGVGLAAGMVSGNASMGAVCFSALVLASWRLWFPVTFELGTKGVIQSTLFFTWRLPWRCFARYETRAHGAWLLTTAEPTPLSTFRGIYVNWSAQQEQVLAVLEFYLAVRQPRAPISTRTYIS